MSDVSWVRIANVHQMGGGDRYRGLLPYKDGYITWNTLGLSDKYYHNEIQGIALKNPYRNDFFIVFEGISTHSNSIPFGI